MASPPPPPPPPSRGERRRSDAAPLLGWKGWGGGRRCSACSSPRRRRRPRPSPPWPRPPEGFRTYEDEANKFSIAIPQDWLIGAGEVSGFKSVTAFYPDQVADSNVSVAITGIGPDFTSLKSFGDVDAFAETLVNGLDRSWKRPPGVAAKLINSRAANGFYYIEYTLQNPGEQRRHIVSAIGMAFNGWYNRLYTVTGQYIDEDGDVDKYRAQIEKCVQSFRFT